jgi:predicted DCC family thiol-disulfide oxidoreductase YuxK
MKMDMERDYLLLDGDCGLCNRLAIFLDKRLAKGMDIAYRPILSEDGQELIATFPKKQQDADSVYLFRKGKSYIRSAAGIRGLLYMRWYYKMWFPILWLIPFPIRDVGYRIIAKYRHKIFKKPETCLFRID